MEKSTLGQLPEGFSHLSKFRPADLLDFSRRAKNLAKVLILPLQEAQSILARAFGYAHLHELHQVLKEPGEIGPYEDQLAVFSAHAGDIAYQLRFYRHERLMRCLTEDRSEFPSDERAEREAFACDLGLFSSPPGHRAATKAVIEFLQSGNGFTQDGYPFGYNGVIHSRYRLWRSEIDLEACEAFPGLAGYPFHPNAIRNPVEHLRQLRRYRASHIFIKMVERAVPDLAKQGPEILLNLEGIGGIKDGEAELLLQKAFDFDIQVHLMRIYYGEQQLDDAPWEGDDAEALLSAMLDPNDTHIEACAWTRGIPDFRTKLSGWRLSLRFQFAKLFAVGDFDEYFDIEGEPKLLTVIEGNDCLFLMMEKNATNEDFQRWRMNGMAMNRTATEAPWTPTGVLTGEYYIPADDGHFSPPDHVLSYFDDEGNSELYRVWSLLESLYIPRAGYERYGDWVNDDQGSALVNVRYWEPINPLEAAVSCKPLDLLVSVFQEGYTNSWDSNWEKFGRPDEQSFDWCDINEADYEMPAIGVVFLPQAGTGNLGYAVWDGQTETATVQMLRTGGEKVGRGRRRSSFMDSDRTGKGWEVLERVKAIPADFVVYDPEEQVPGEE